MDREAWRAAIHGVAKSWTWLSDWSDLIWSWEGIEQKTFSHVAMVLSTQRHDMLYTTVSRTEVFIFCHQIRSVAQSCPTLCDPMNCSTPGLPVHHQLPEFTETSIESVMPSSHLILCCPLLLLPPILPSIRVFSNESTLCMRWPKYWSFSFSISPSNMHRSKLCECMSGFSFLTSTLQTLLWKKKKKWLTQKYK